MKNTPPPSVITPAKKPGMNRVNRSKLILNDEASGNKHDSTEIITSVDGDTHVCRIQDGEGGGGENG